jgi:cobalamin biosynthetic protein CobC
LTAAAASLAVHGGRLTAASRRFGRDVSDWVDLSTGIGPDPYPFDGSLVDPHRLPEPEELAALEATAAAAFGVAEPDTVVAVPGSDLALRLLPLLVPARCPAILVPAYGGHAEAWPRARPLGLAEVAAGGFDADLLILCNPNNPDGRVLPPAQLRGLGVRLIVDEAFADAHPEASLLPERAGAVVLRSFGKFFGLAGLRLGFVIADRPLAARLRALLGAWPVSAAAIAAGRAAYADHGWHVARRRRLAGAAARLDALLAGAGLAIAGGTRLFRLARHPGAASLFSHLAAAGILVRPFADRPDTLRFGIPGPERAWQRLSAALATWEARP